jgi:hypothetical protein
LRVELDVGVEQLVPARKIASIAVAVEARAQASEHVRRDARLAVGAGRVLARACDTNSSMLACMSLASRSRSPTGP